MNTTEMNTNKAVMDISREFDIPFKQVLSDLEKLQKSLNNCDDPLEELKYYYKCKIHGMD